MKKITYILIFVFFGTSTTMAQVVGINIDTPETSAALHIEAEDKGLLLPRTSLDSINGAITPINSPTESLFVWNTNPNVLYGSGIGPYYFQNNKWVYAIESSTLDDCYDKGGDGAGYFIDADSGPVYINQNASGTNDAFVVTGKLSLGNTFTEAASVPNYGDGTVMYYSNRKSAFRAGRVTSTQWDDTNVGRHSFSSGFNNVSTGNRTFTANFNNQSLRLNSTTLGENNVNNGENSMVFGSNNSISQKRVLATGKDNLGNGLVAFVSGIGNNSRVFNESVLGLYSSLYPKFDSSGGIGPNDNGLPPGTDSEFTAYNEDRIFSVGIGTSALSKKSALEIIKTGEVIVNESYSLPKVDGTNDYVLTTDGSGNLGWTDRIVDANVTNLTITANSFNYVVPSLAYQVIPGASLPINYKLYDTDNDGIVEVRIMANFSNRVTAANGNESQILVKGMVNNIQIFGPGQFAFNNATEGVLYQTSWSAIDATELNAAGEDILYFEARNRNGGVSGTADDSQLTIHNISILIRDR